MLAIGPTDSQALFSPGHQARSTEVRSQDCNSHAPGPTVGAMEAAQTLTSPNFHVYMLTKPTVAKARPVSAAGVLAVLSDVPQVLNLGSHQWRCNSVVHAAVRRDFNSSSLATWLLSLSCFFSPISACGPPTTICSQGCQSI